jgi:hypothetical protein
VPVTSHSHFPPSAALAAQPRLGDRSNVTRREKTHTSLKTLPSRRVAWRYWAEIFDGPKSTGRL